VEIRVWTRKAVPLADLASGQKKNRPAFPRAGQIDVPEGFFGAQSLSTGDHPLPFVVLLQGMTSGSGVGPKKEEL
jgi:hypothetical protein